MSWELESVPLSQEDDGTGFIELKLRRVEAVARKSCTFYFVGPSPFASQGDEIAFQDALFRLHNKGKDQWFLCHLGAADASGFLLGSLGRRIDREEIQRFLRAAGWYGGWWPNSWEQTLRWIKWGLLDLADVNFVFLQDRCDRAPLGWNGENLSQFVDHRSDLPNKPRTSVTVAGTSGDAFWTYAGIVRRFSLEELCAQMLDLAATEAKAGPADELSVSVFGTTSVDRIASGWKLLRREGGRQLAHDGLSPLGQVLSLCRVKLQDGQKFEIKGLTLLVT